MKTKRVITGLAATALLLGFAGTAAADRYGSRGVYDYAHVISARPVVRYVTVRTPVQECWQDTEYYTVRHGHRRGGTLLGAVVGGVVGHQFGSGRGNDAATVAGTVIGAAIGNDIDRRHRRVYTTEHARPVRRCETRYESHREERIEGYDVLYRYRGQKYSTRMPYDPGRKLRIRVDVRPAR